MKILAIESSTLSCSVAFYDGLQVLEHTETVHKGHSQRILPMLDELLATAQCSMEQIQGLAYGRGPGAFTGLRMAAAVVQALAFAHDLPVVGVSCLAALAQGANYPRVLCALDARMGEVYWGVYQCDASGQWHLHAQEQVCAPNEVICPAEGDWLGVGSGWALYHDALSQMIPTRLVATDTQAIPCARHMATLALSEFNAGRVIAAHEVWPIYLRDNVVKKMDMTSI